MMDTWYIKGVMVMGRNTYHKLHQTEGKTRPLVTGLEAVFGLALM
jgi:hypothetical protein